MSAVVYSVLGARHAHAKPTSVLLRHALDCAAREDWAAAYDTLQRAAEDPSDERAARFMLWEVCQILGYRDVALANLQAALHDNPVTSRQCAAPLRRILALAVPGDFQANLPLDALLDAGGTEIHTLWLSDPEAILKNPMASLDGCLPPFDCVFISIAEDVRHRRALEAADRLAEALNVPVINRGRRIAAVSRTGAAQMLKDVPHAIVPSQTVMERASLVESAGLAFPLIIRPTGSHAGSGLACVDSSASLQRYLAEATGQFFYVAPFVDYRSADGFWRKYRIIFVDGRPWPYHLAIHSDWAIWYYNARMDLDPWKRAEEAHFLDDIEQAFPPHAMTALRCIATRVGLDYFGIDCSVVSDGRLVVFEIETGMIVHDWDSPTIYPYRRKGTRAIREATERMIDSRIEARGSWAGPSRGGLNRADCLDAGVLVA